MIDLNYTGILATRLVKQDSRNIEFIKFTNWALANLSRGKILDKEKQSVAIFCFLKNIQHQTDLEILDEAILALSDLIDEEDIALLVETNILGKLHRISQNCTVSTLSSILEIVNNVSFSSAKGAIKSIFESGFVERIYEILNDDVVPAPIKKDCLWILSNLTVEDSSVISKVLNSQEKFKIINRYCNHQNNSIKSEALQVLCNITSKGNLEQKQFLVDNGIFKIFSFNLKDGGKVKDIKTILEALENILRDIFTMNESLEDYVHDLLEDSGVVDCLEDLLQHKNTEVYQLSLGVIESYFDIEEAF